MKSRITPILDVIVAFWESLKYMFWILFSQDIRGSYINIVDHVIRQLLVLAFYMLLGAMLDGHEQTNMIYDVTNVSRVAQLYNL